MDSPWRMNRWENRKNHRLSKPRHWVLLTSTGHDCCHRPRGLHPHQSTVSLPIQQPRTAGAAEMPHVWELAPPWHHLTGTDDWHWRPKSRWSALRCCCGDPAPNSRGLSRQTWSSDLAMVEKKLPRWGLWTDTGWVLRVCWCLPMFAEASMEARLFSSFFNLVVRPWWLTSWNHPTQFVWDANKQGAKYRRDKAYFVKKTHCCCCLAKVSKPEFHSSNALTFLPVEPASGVTTRDLNRSMHIISLALVVKCPHIMKTQKVWQWLCNPGLHHPLRNLVSLKLHVHHHEGWPRTSGGDLIITVSPSPSPAAASSASALFANTSIDPGPSKIGTKKRDEKGAFPSRADPKWGFNGTFSHPCEIRKSLGGHVCHTGSQALTFLRGVHEKSSNGVAYPKQKGSGMLRVLAGSPFQWTDSGTTGYELVA